MVKELDIYMNVGGIEKEFVVHYEVVEGNGPIMHLVCADCGEVYERRRFGSVRIVKIVDVTFRTSSLPKKGDGMTVPKIIPEYTKVECSFHETLKKNYEKDPSNQCLECMKDELDLDE